MKFLKLYRCKQKLAVQSITMFCTKTNILTKYLIIISKKKWMLHNYNNYLSPVVSNNWKKLY